MSENPFASALRLSLGQALEAFETADADLHAAVNDADAAVQDVTGGSLSLKLDRISDTARGRSYDLDLLGVSGQTDGIYNVGGFFIASKGYPIKYGNNLSSYDGAFETKGYLKNIDEIKSHIMGMMSNPDSPITVIIVYEMRKSK